eukprot:1193252-Amphidinium_carterae.1
MELGGYSVPLPIQLLQGDQCLGKVDSLSVQQTHWWGIRPSAQAIVALLERVGCCLKQNHLLRGTLPAVDKGGQEWDKRPQLASRDFETRLLSLWLDPADCEPLESVLMHMLLLVEGHNHPEQHLHPLGLIAPIASKGEGHVEHCSIEVGPNAQVHNVEPIDPDTG